MRMYSSTRRDIHAEALRGVCVRGLGVVLHHLLLWGRILRDDLSAQVVHRTGE